MSTVFNEPKYAIETSDYRCVQCETEMPCEAAYYSAVTLSTEEFRRANYCSVCWAQRLAARAGDANAHIAGEEDVFAFWKTRRPAAVTERPKRLRFAPELLLQFFLRLGESSVEVQKDATSTVDPIAQMEGDPSTENALGPSSTQEDEGAGSSVTTDDTGVRDSNNTEAPDDASEYHDASGDRLAGAEAVHLRFFLALLLIRRKRLVINSTVHRDGMEWLVLRDSRERSSTHEVLNPSLTEDQLERLKDRLGELLHMQI